MQPRTGDQALKGRIEAHAQPDARRRIEVPEWAERDEAGNLVDGGKPLVITYTMVTLQELAEVEAVTAGKGFSDQAPHIVALKACDEDGKPMFKRMDHIFLRDRAAPEVVRRIALEMLGRVTVEDARKN